MACLHSRGCSEGEWGRTKGNEEVVYNENYENDDDGDDEVDRPCSSLLHMNECGVWNQRRMLKEPNGGGEKQVYLW